MTATFKVLLSFVLVGCAVGRKETLTRRLDHAHAAKLVRRNDGADPLRFAATGNTGSGFGTPKTPAGFVPGSAGSAGQMHFSTDVSGFTGGEMNKYCPKDFFIGAAVDNPELKFPELAKVAKEFHYWTPGNSLKMQFVYENEQSWTELRTGMQKLVGEEPINWKYHTLVWGAEQSQTMMQKSFSKEAMMKTITDFVSTKMCPKITKEAKFWGIDVLNEVFADDGKGFKRNGYFEVIGEEGYKSVLKLVKQKCPDYKIIVNDYGLEGLNPKSDFAFKTIKQWLAEGVPVDVVGLQFHVNLENKYEDMLGAISRWTKEKIAVVLSEVDIPVNLPPTPQDLEKQAQQYGAVFQAALEGGAFGVTVWGTLDKGSWFGDQKTPGVGHGKTGAPLLFSDDGKPKPAVAAIVDVFKKWGDKPVGFEGGRLSETTGAKGDAKDASKDTATEPKDGHGGKGDHDGTNLPKDGGVGAPKDGSATPYLQDPRPKQGGSSSIGAEPIVGDTTGNGSGTPVGVDVGGSSSGDNNSYGDKSGDKDGYGDKSGGDQSSSIGKGTGGDAAPAGTPYDGASGEDEKPKKKKHHGHQGHKADKDGDESVPADEQKPGAVGGDQWYYPNNGSGSGAEGVNPEWPSSNPAPVHHKHSDKANAPPSCDAAYDSSCNADADPKSKY